MPSFRAHRAAWTLAAVLTASCLALAFHGARPGYLELAPDAAQRLAGEQLGALLRASGQEPATPEPDAFRFYANATFGARIDLPRADRVPLELVARGRAADGVWPYVVVRVDGRQVDAFYVSSENWSRFSSEVALDAGRHTVEWAYVNDATHFPRARDLDVRALAISSELTDAHPARWSVPCRIAPTRASRRSFGETSPNGYRLWPRGVLGEDVHVPQTDRYAVALELAEPTAAATTVTLSVDGETVAELDVAAGASRVEQTIALPAGTRRLVWTHAGDDGDLVVDAIRVGEPADAHLVSVASLGQAAVDVSTEGIEVGWAGQVTDDGVVVWPYGHLVRRIEVARPGTWRLELRAGGRGCQEEGPHLLVLAGDDQWARLEVAPDALRDYSIPLELEADTREIFLVHDDDVPGAGDCDRGVVVAGIGFTPEMTP